MGKSFLRAIQFNIEDPYGFYADKVSAETLVDVALRTHANTLVVFARDPWGRVFYDGSKIYPKHPNAALDLRKLRELTREKRLRLIIMVDHTANRYVYRKHPEYAQRNKDGEVIVLEHLPTTEKVSDPHWPQICLNSPALEEYLIPEAEEAARVVGPDGVLLDSFRYFPDPPKACYCRYCRTRFKEENNAELPEVEDEEDPAFRLAWEWRHKVTIESMKKIREAVKKTKPDALFLYNSHPVGWAGRGNIIVEKARELFDGVFAEASEFDIIDYTYIVIATKLSRALVNSEKVVLVSRNLFYIFRTVQSVTELAVKQGIRSIVAAGGYPIATIFSSQFFEDPRALNYLAEVYEEIERVEDLITSVEPVKYAAILFDSETHDKYFWRKPAIYLAELEGLTQILMSRNLPTEFITMKNLKKVKDYEVLVAPTTAVLGDEEEELLRNYVEDGGVLLATGEFGIMRPDYTYRHALALEKYLGITFEGFLNTGYIYLQLDVTPTIYEDYWSGLPRSVILGDQSLRFRVERTEKELGDLVRVRPTNAKVLSLVKTTKAPYGYEYTLGRSTPPPDSNLENTAGIVLTHLGSGLALYYTGRIGAHYSRIGHPDYAELILRPLMKHVSKSPVIVEGPETLQTEYYRKGDRIITHIVNHTYNQRILTAPTGPSKQALPTFIPPYSVHPPRTVIPIHDIVVRARVSDPQKTYRAYEAISGQDLETSMKRNYVETRLKSLKEYALVVIEPRT
ncbi:MAG: alpha-amylase family protein [Desulfurococcaceae archaeon TW002]